eukprot:223111-Amphidinium_carterae.1
MVVGRTGSARHVVGVVASTGLLALPPQVCVPPHSASCTATSGAVHRGRLSRPNNGIGSCEDKGR